MTYAYSDMNQHDALYKVARAYPGGIEALVQRMGVSSAVLYNKLRPGIDSHHTTFEQVSEIVELCLEAKVVDALQPLHAMNWRHGLVAFPLPAPSDRNEACLIRYVCKSVQEFGHVTSAVTGALADGKISVKEEAEIEQEFQHVFAALTELREHIRKTIKTQKGGAA